MFSFRRHRCCLGCFCCSFPRLLGVRARIENLDAALLLTAGSFLLTVELLCLQLCFGASLLTVRAFLLTFGVLLLIVELLCIQWESASNQHLNGL